MLGQIISYKKNPTTFKVVLVFTVLLLIAGVVFLFQ
jgi:hypothetical protein